jgi:hypothetical protein
MSPVIRAKAAMMRGASMRHTASIAARVAR